MHDYFHVYTICLAIKIAILIFVVEKTLLIIYPRRKTRNLFRENPPFRPWKYIWFGSWAQGMESTETAACLNLPSGDTFGFTLSERAIMRLYIIFLLYFNI